MTVFISSLPTRTSRGGRGSAQPVIVSSCCTDAAADGTPVPACIANESEWHSPL